VKTKKYILCFFLLLSLSASSQNSPSPFKVWGLLSFSGEVKVRGTYREYKSKGSYIASQKGAFVTGMIRVNTKSFFVHPNFMVLDLSANYNPETTRSSYIENPDYAEVSNRGGFETSALFFGKKKLNLTTNASLNNSIQNIENIRKIFTKTRLLGATIAYTNKYVPCSVSYNDIKSDQRTIGLDRKFSIKQRLFQGNASTSLTSHDSHNFNYNRTESSSIQSDTTLYTAPFHSRNTIDIFELRDEVAFDTTKKYIFTSYLSNSNQRGSLNFKRFLADERLILRLPKNFIFASGYSLIITRQDLFKSNNQGIESSLSHQLYKSLKTTVFFESNIANQTSYKEQRNKVGFILNYDKKIPYGRVASSYQYSRNFQNVKTNPSELDILYEEYTLSDYQITYLQKPNVDIQSVVVKDVTGSIIYQLGIDYVLIEHPPYLEIARVPGGMILNNEVVYIDYTAMQPGLYKYNMDNHIFHISLLFFDDRLSVYYSFSSQVYHIPQYSEFLTVDYFTRHLAGARFHFHFLDGGAEYEDNKSSIIPLKRLHCFLNLQKTYKKFTFTLTGNMQLYKMLQDNSKRQDIDVTGKIAYSVLKKTTLFFDLMYRNQQGKGMDLDLITSRLDITSDIRRFSLSAGVELNLIHEFTIYRTLKGVYLQIGRKF